MAILYYGKEKVTWEKVFEAVKDGLKKYDIRYDIIGNPDFNILEVCGGYKYYKNLLNFSKKIGFVHDKKQKDLKLILSIFRERRSIQINRVLDFLKEGKTLREVIESFQVPKSTAYRILNSLVKKDVIEKTNTFPNVYKLIGTL